MFDPTQSLTSPTRQHLADSQEAITFAYYIAYITLGLSIASLGPTLFSLAENTQTGLS